MALFESPAQLLNVIEWAAHHGTAAQTRLMAGRAGAVGGRGILDEVTRTARERLP